MRQAAAIAGRDRPAVGSRNRPMRLADATGWRDRLARPVGAAGRCEQFAPPAAAIGSQDSSPAAAPGPRYRACPGPGAARPLPLLPSNHPMSGFSMLPDLHFTGGEREWPDSRRLPREGAAQALVDSRNRTLAWLAAFGHTRRGWAVPRQYDADPPLWTLGQIAWHAEWWCLRDVRYVQSGDVTLPVPASPSRLAGADEWFDPERIGHDERWEAALPDVAVVKRYAADVLDGLLRRLAVLPDDSDAALYPFRRALFHEDACSETIAALLQALGVAPVEPAAVVPSISVPYAGTLQFPGGRFTQGWSERDGFALPDELPAQPTYVPAFEID